MKVSSAPAGDVRRLRPSEWKAFDYNHPMNTVGSRLIALIYGCVAFATLAALFAERFWLLELFSHFRVQYVALILLLLALLASFGRWLAAAALLPLLALNVAPLLPYLAAPGAAASAAEGTVRLASINLRGRNEETGRLLELLATEQPEVVVFQEFTPRWATTLARLQAQYRYSVQVPREGAFGIALLSVYPVVAHEVIELGGPAFPAIRATVQLGERELRVIGAHSAPPTSAELAAQRNQQLVRLGQLAASTPTPLVLLGDFNVTPWSPYLQRLLHTAGLRSGWEGSGLSLTWPTFMPLLGIPIDHCLVSEDLAVVRQSRGPTFGSDHYPLFIQLSL